METNFFVGISVDGLPPVIRVHAGCKVIGFFFFLGGEETPTPPLLPVIKGNSSN